MSPPNALAVSSPSDELLAELNPPQRLAAAHALNGEGGPLLIIAGILLLLTVALYGYMFLWTGDRLRSPDELTRVALTGGSDVEKEKAALDLAPGPEFEAAYQDLSRP